MSEKRMFREDHYKGLPLKYFLGKQTMKKREQLYGNNSSRGIFSWEREPTLWERANQKVS